MCKGQDSCSTCRFALRVKVACDDNRLFCGNDKTKRFPEPIGFVTAISSCPLYEKAAVQQQAYVA
jgi:hypothetical protein